MAIAQVELWEEVCTFGMWVRGEDGEEEEERGAGSGSVE